MQKLCVSLLQKRNSRRLHGLLLHLTRRQNSLNSPLRLQPPKEEKSKTMGFKASSFLASIYRGFGDLFLSFQGEHCSPDFQLVNQQNHLQLEPVVFPKLKSPIHISPKMGQHLSSVCALIIFRKKEVKSNILLLVEVIFSGAFMAFHLQGVTGQLVTNAQGQELDVTKKTKSKQVFNDDLRCSSLAVVVRVGEGRCDLIGQQRGPMCPFTLQAALFTLTLVSFPLLVTLPPSARDTISYNLVHALILIKPYLLLLPLYLTKCNFLYSDVKNRSAVPQLGGISSVCVQDDTLVNIRDKRAFLETIRFTQIIGTIPLMPNSVGPSSQSGCGTPSLQVQPITPQLLTNAQGQIIATVIGNQILPVINTQGITLSPIKPGQQLPQVSQTPQAPPVSQPNLLRMPHSQSPLRQASSSSSTSSSSSALSVGQLVSNPQNAPSEVDGVNLEEIREFAKAFKIRRLSLGLTQTQVGQALSATEGPAYSQSAICRHTILRSHFFLPQEAQENTIASSLTGKLNPGLLYPARFEKLDITPKSAQKIKPVLERWMAEAEARHRSGMQNLTEFIGSEPSKKRKRRTSFTPQALEILNSHFEKNTHPSGQEMTEIAEKLNYDREVVRVWFCNKRQALKNTIKRLKQPELGAPMDPMGSLLNSAQDEE
ncbi:POU domain, class 6, transcription factor 2 [Triplophysa tibetana]|uniref:POU domain protein n=1 Tax=Triplophysa tibetana TaxID=1572043 RepID=A0A5A9N6M3_9TELE|nr:POU domain, class 6, transcription factor 2 [Triplophysa tibetana]